MVSGGRKARFYCILRDRFGPSKHLLSTKTKIMFVNFAAHKDCRLLYLNTKSATCFHLERCLAFFASLPVRNVTYTFFLVLLLLPVKC